MLWRVCEHVEARSKTTARTETVLEDLERRVDGRLARCIARKSASQKLEATDALQRQDNQSSVVSAMSKLAFRAVGRIDDFEGIVAILTRPRANVPLQRAMRVLALLRSASAVSPPKPVPEGAALRGLSRLLQPRLQHTAIMPAFLQRLLMPRAAAIRCPYTSA
jgi:hypothetical protein